MQIPDIAASGRVRLDLLPATRHFPPMTLPLSILDLAPVSEGTSTPDALRETVALAQLGEELGYTRVWYAEHHGMPSIASSSPDVLIATAAAQHQDHPGRLGRRDAAQPRAAAGGRDLPHAQWAQSGPHRSRHRPGRRQRRAHAQGAPLVRRRAFCRAAFRDDGVRGRRLSRRAIRSSRCAWCRKPSTCRRSGCSARAAPAPRRPASSGSATRSPRISRATPAKPAFDAYRASFQPTAQFPKPHAILCVSAIVAPTDEEALFLSGSQALSWALFHSGKIRKLIAPEEAARARLHRRRSAPSSSSNARSGSSVRRRRSIG